MYSQNLYTYYDCKHLRFVLDALTATGLSPQSYGKLTDNPPSTSQALRVQLKQDDMKLSKAKQFVSTLGYDLTVDLLEKNRTTSSDYKLILPEKLQQNLERGILEQEDKNKNLSFLLRFMSHNGITKRRLARVLEMSPGAINAWFRADDILISYLFKIKNVLQADIAFSISERDEHNDIK